MTAKTPICRRCGKPIVINAFHCEVFEGMHWVCFHLEYEHLNHDADEPCDDPSCFWERFASPKAGSLIK